MTARIEDHGLAGQASHQDDVLSLMLIREGATELEDQMMDQKYQAENQDRSQDLAQVE